MDADCGLVFLCVGDEVVVSSSVSICLWCVMVCILKATQTQPHQKVIPRNLAAGNAHATPSTTTPK